MGVGDREQWENTYCTLVEKQRKVLCSPPPPVSCPVTTLLNNMGSPLDLAIESEIAVKYCELWQYPHSGLRLLVSLPADICTFISAEKKCGKKKSPWRVNLTSY
jgi:hypothetical protein